MLPAGLGVLTLHKEDVTLHRAVGDRQGRSVSLGRAREATVAGAFVLFALNRLLARLLTAQHVNIDGLGTRVRMVGRTLIDLVIAGAGGHGRELYDIVEAQGAANLAIFRFLGFLDDGEIDAGLLDRLGAPLLGPIARLNDIDASYLAGAGDPSQRRAIDAVAGAAGRRAATMVHPFTAVGGDTEWGDGFVLCPGATVTTNIRFGRHCHVNRNATVGHDCRIGDFVTINPSANLGGKVTIGADVTIGAGATVIQGVSIGAGTNVGAGAAVVRDLPPGVTAVGVPARPLGHPGARDTLAP